MPEISDEQLKKYQDAEERAKNLEASKSRIEDEKEKLKKRAQDAEGKISDAEKAKLEEEGKLNELLLQERKDKSELEEKLQKRTKSVLNEKVKSEVLKHAKDAHDIEMLYELKNTKTFLKLTKTN